jgi:hypothetical protein
VCGPPSSRRSSYLVPYFTGCYKKNTHNVLNCHKAAKHCKSDARGAAVPNTATASAPAVEIKMATSTGAERARCVFWFEDTKSLTQVQRKVALSITRNHPVGLQFTHDTRIL